MTTYRLVVRGLSGVGKSAVIVRFTQRVFIEEYDPTIEDAYIKQWEIGGETCILDIHENVVCEDQSMVEKHIRSSDGVMLIYSITDQRSFDEVPSLIEQAKRVKEDVVFVLAGNKCDLESERVVTKEEGKRMADEERIIVD
eukprot:TRINITY_DN5652_c0_g1_i6.p1 TRINITY_DN5652_c0_g1~~TRINITY_DN5652_c0_g1_i6.p1  ORF type:complete len:141 (+),score=30.91 TRINITY_DN5652_c0_g1_i6:198-620(+)